MSHLPTHLDAEKALAVALAALGTLWPRRAVTLTPLKPLTKPLRATVFRVSGGPQPAVAKVWGPGNAARATAQAARQAEVAAAMARGPCRVPGVLGFDAARNTLIMTDPGGESLRTLGERGTAVAAQAGGWLAAFHDLSLRAHPFRPAGHLAWAARLKDAVRSGARVLPEPEGFAARIDALTPLAAAARGSPACRAVTHRDMTLANLVTGGGAVWGIDFENTREDEPLRDLFTLALDLCVLSPGATGRDTALAALRQGYGREVAAPEARLFLQQAFALGVWANTPVMPSRRQAARLEAAQWMLGLGEPVI